jgi:hypothetical protein
MFVSYIYQAWDREKEDGVKEARVQSSYCELYCLDGSEKYPTWMVHELKATENVTVL